MEKRKQTDAPTIDCRAYIEHLDAVNALETAQGYKQKTYDLLDVKKGHRILDVGCGTGDDVQILARAVGDDGRVMGIDNNEIMIAEAQKRSQNSDLPVDYRLCDVHGLLFADNTFDGCRSYRVFNSLEDPEQALAEMIRVCLPGGRIVVTDIDSDTFVIDHVNRALTRKIHEFICHNMVRNSWIGRQLYGLCKQSGLVGVTVTCGTMVLTDYDMIEAILSFKWVLACAQEAGALSTDEVSDWLDQLEETGHTGRFFSAITLYTVSGAKPPNSE
jgi:ubiquinone/menaquinone biosynthesis C-methylase UbiE